MIEIDSAALHHVQGFEITGFASDRSGHVPTGILVTGASDRITIDGTSSTTWGPPSRDATGAMRTASRSSAPTRATPIEEIAIIDNELRHLTLGSSEALVVNGNVEDFLIEGNRVHDTNNIGIDVIGFEGMASDPTVDQARDG